MQMDYLLTHRFYRYRVTNGLQPSVQMVLPRSGEKISSNYDGTTSVTLGTEATNPSWDWSNNNYNELSSSSGLMFFVQRSKFVGRGNRIRSTNRYELDWRPKSSGTFKVTAVAVTSASEDDIAGTGGVLRGSTIYGEPIEIEILQRSSSRIPVIDFVYQAHGRRKFL